MCTLTMVVCTRKPENKFLEMALLSPCRSRESGLVASPSTHWAILTASSFLFSLGPPAHKDSCFPHLEWIFPPQSNLFGNNLTDKPLGVSA